MTRRAWVLAAFVLLATVSLSSPALAIDEPDRLWMVGEQAAADGLHPLARRTLERFVERYPADPRASQALLLLGRTRLAQGAHEAALDAIRRAQATGLTGSRAREARFWEAEALFRLKRYAEARGAYDEVLRHDMTAPFAPDALYGYGWTELEMGRPESAASAFRDLLQTWPEHSLAPSATYHLARVLMELKRPTEVVALLAGFPSKHPRSAHAGDARYLLGVARLETGDSHAGLADLRAFVGAHPEHPRAGEARRLLTQEAARAGDPAALQAVYADLVAQTPATADGLAEAVAIAVRLGRPVDQEPAVRKLVAEFPAHPLAQKAAFDAATAAFERKRWREAATWADTAARSDNEALRAEAWLLLGESELKLKRYAAAAKAFQAVDALDGVDAAVRYRALAGLGLAREEQKEWRAALTAYESVATQSPDDALRDWAKQRVTAVRARLPKPAPSPAPAAKPSPSPTPGPASKPKKN